MMKKIIATTGLIFFGFSLLYCQQKDTMAAWKLEQKAIGYGKVFKYDSAAHYYIYATNIYEQQEEWHNCAENYRKVSHNYLQIAKYDSAMIFAEKALAIAEKYFNTSNKDEMFEKSDVLLNLADANEKKGKYEEELNYCKKAMVLIAKTDSSDSLRIAKVWDKTGTAYTNLEKYDSAFQFCDSALNLKIKHLGDKHIDVAESNVNIGMIYLKKGEYDKALIYFQKALEIRLVVLCKKHPDIANCFSNVGVVYEHQGEYNKALEYFQKALNINIEVLGEQHPLVASSLNNVGITYNDKGEYDKALEYFQKALKIDIKTFGDQHPNIADNLRHIGVTYFFKGEYDKALEYYQKALKIYIEVLGEQHLNLNMLYNNIGSTYRLKGEYDKALKYYQKALRINIKTFGEQHNLIATIYNNIGTIYHLKGEYDKALEYYQKALKINIITFGEQHPFDAKIYNNIGITYNNKGEYDKALEYYQKALKIRIGIFGKQHPDVATTYTNIGEAYDNKGEYNKALEYYQKALNIRIEVMGKQHPYVAYSLNKIGVAYQNKGEYDKALEYYQKALKIYIEALGKQHPDVAGNYNNSGALNSLKGEYNKAIQNYQKGLMANLPGFIDTAIYSNPKLEKVLSKPVLLSSLTGKAEALYLLFKHETKAYSDLKASLSTYELAFELTNTMRNESNIENTKLLLSKNTKNNYATAVYAAMEYDQINQTPENGGKIFDFIEKGKSATLAALLNELNATHLAGIPDSLIEEEKDLKRNINDLTTKIDNEKYRMEGYDTLNINALENEHFTYSRKLDSLISFFEITYPAYYELKYNNKIATIPAIQKALDSHTAILNYFEADTSLFIAAVTKDTVVYKMVKTDSLFNQQMMDYYIDVKSGFGNKEARNSAKLYHYLVSPVEGLIKEKNSLVIIPDGNLYYVPFETLCKNGKADDLTSVDFLIKKYTVSYHHSATLWLHGTEKTGKEQSVNNSFIGFAPMFDPKINNGYMLSNGWISDTTNTNLATRSVSSDLKHFNALPFSEKEVKSILNLFQKYGQKADGYFLSEASEENFKKQAPNYNYIHIASHSFTNDKYPALSGIAFSQTDTTALSGGQKEDGILYAGESYNLNLSKANLVVLSSCKSGLGKMINGEGFLSLSRGFLYSGVPNIVFSLWNVNDERTKDLMVCFYKQLLSGKNYANSLRDAKLKLIGNPKTAEPKYWAAWVLVGN